ncbi:MAG TPA: hypothetical protein PK109_02170, partial [Candidatus Paceibacterota bacterium]|nr:hypothetical protein [Candidatus Paceibacterota bacterium]
LFGILRASLQVSGLSKLKATATTIASSQMEYIRSLSYTAIGTDGGIPAGAIAQTATTTNGGLPFTVRTYIEYADDAKDGVGAADTNGITTDYKHIKVTVSYTVAGVTRSVTLVSNAAPPGLETTTGGGTLSANIVNAVGTAVTGATVRIVNASTSPDIDLTTFSDSYGQVILPGAPTSTQYQISVTKTGYSTATTYARTATNANPSPGYLTVVGGSTTSSTFAIDLLGTLILRTFSPIAAALWTDLFTDTSKVVSFSNTQVIGGALTLSGGVGTYPASGTALSTTTAPTYLAQWTNASSTISLPVGTTALVSVTDASGTLLPDAALPGNAAGFSGTITLSSVSTTTYPALKLRATLTSSDPNVTPSISDWRIGYDEGPLPLPNVSFTLTSSKTIGSTSGGASIYKTTIATTTDSSGVRTLSLEWDLYQLSIPGKTIVTASPDDPPIELLPGATVDERLILTTP